MIIGSFLVGASILLEHVSPDICFWALGLAMVMAPHWERGYNPMRHSHKVVLKSHRCSADFSQRRVLQPSTPRHLW